MTTYIPKSTTQKRFNSTSHGMIMTDLGMILIIFVAVFFAIDPFVLYIDKRTVFKHIHLVLAIPVFILAWAGMRIGHKRRVFMSVTAICWPLMIFSVWVISGALYARFQSHIIETFLILGLYLSVTFGAARFIADHRDPTALLNTYFGFIIFAILTSVLWQVVSLKEWSKLHELEAFTVPLAVFFYIRAKSDIGRAISVMLMFLLMLLVIKNTSFIALGLTLSYVWWCFIRERISAKPFIGRIFHYYTLLIVITSVAGAYFIIRYLSKSALPDGNTKYRFFTYERTWEDFITSPVWGKSFSGAGAEQFGLFHVGASTQILPSHSDLLDILGQGGIIGISLFTFGVWRIVLYLRTKFSNRHANALNETLVAHFHWLAVSCICTIPVIAFNPILLQPGKAFVTWVNLGILVGLAMRCTEFPQKKNERTYF